METGELGLAEGLRENVGGVNVIKNVRYPNQSSIDVVANPVVRAMHMLHHALVFGMLRDLQGRPVVEEGRRSRLVISDVLEEVPHQHYLASDLGSNRVFHLRGGWRKGGYPLRSTTTHTNCEATRGPTVSVGVGHKPVGRRRARECTSLIPIEPFR